jgi:hypothetical protein
MTPTGVTALLERQAELDALRRAVDAARSGRGAVMLVEYRPGSARPACSTPRARTRERAGFRVLSARGAVGA